MPEKKQSVILEAVPGKVPAHPQLPTDKEAQALRQKQDQGECVDPPIILVQRDLKTKKNKSQYEKKCQNGRVCYANDRQKARAREIAMKEGAFTRAARNQAFERAVGGERRRLSRRPGTVI